ncbi:CinA family protein [Lachnobacterium bovis]|uniref:Nicotinamide-nucleotide amidase n=1 Tax=Lachnobacterium bovis TaxID=140626 RepID=A0A1H9QPP5_9FIRM|nr:CinA family protein [Lachnobacterium bovis]SER62390.1 nicotinamide-nucleotide amidase [Lachnobacterium bovis]
MSRELYEKRLYEILKQKNWKLSTAESCTGGLVAATVVNISGISEFFEEGFITYSSRAKVNRIGVEPDVIEKYGVVSNETAEAMALATARTANSDCSISTTGVAGPNGGTREVPVGCICIGCSIKGKAYSEKVIFKGTRQEIRQQAAVEAIRYLIEKIEEVS